jgi:hypothetical protein
MPGVLVRDVLGWRQDVGVVAWRTLEDPHGGGEVVDPPGSAQGGDDDRGRGNEIVGEAVVQVPLSVYQLIAPFPPVLSSPDTARHANVPGARKHR